MALEGLQIMQQGFQDLNKGMSQAGSHSRLRKGSEAIMQEDPIEYLGGEQGRTEAAMAYREGNIGAAMGMRDQTSMEDRLTKLSTSIANEMVKPEGQRDNDKIARQQQVFATMGEFYKKINLYKEYGRIVKKATGGGGGGGGGGGKPVEYQGVDFGKEVDLNLVYDGVDEIISEQAPQTENTWSDGKYASEVDSENKFKETAFQLLKDQKVQNKIAENINKYYSKMQPLARDAAYTLTTNAYKKNKNGWQEYKKEVNEKGKTKLQVPTTAEFRPKGFKYTSEDWWPGYIESVVQSEKEGKLKVNNAKPSTSKSEDDAAYKKLKANPKMPNAKEVKTYLKQKGYKF